MNSSSIAIARTPGRPSGPPSRIIPAIQRASSNVVGGASSRLKATSRGRAPTRTAPAVGMDRRRAEVGPQAAVGDPPGQLGQAAAAELGAGAPDGGHLAVEEDGEVELGGEQLGGATGLGDRRASRISGSR